MGSFFENIIDEGFRFLDELIRKIFYELTYVDSSLIKEEAHYVEKWQNLDGHIVIRLEQILIKLMLKL